MTIEFTPWPTDRAQRYRAAGLWNDQPLSQLLIARAAVQPQAPAILCGERRISYGELDRRASNLASRLAAHGLGQGDTALVQLPNVAEFYIVLFALLKAGIAPVNALYSHRQHELGAFARQIQPALLIASAEHEVFRNEAFLDDLAKEGLRPKLTLMLDALDDWSASADVRGTHYTPSAAGEVALFQLSGGSTGTPKLIPRTHNDYAYSVRASAQICALDSATRFLCALPAAHNYTLSSPGGLGVLHAGGCIVMAANPEPLHCFALIERHAVTMAALVPSAVALWLQAAPGHAAKLRSLRLLQVGGASFAEALARQVPEVLGCKLQQVFGMAEGLVNYTRLDDSDEQVFTTQGRPISELERGAHPRRTGPAGR
ncbi:2,3-dihydroxybenzoate-AMP ligase [Pseudomonas hunanensis]|nr:2,3-dihydroxybenzoate-AMP ligase [Pseudomonas hunanensis]